MDPFQPLDFDVPRATYRNAVVVYLWKQSKQSRKYIPLIRELEDKGIQVNVVDVFKHRKMLKHITAVPTILAFGPSGESYTVPPADMWDVDRVQGIMDLQSLTVKPQEIPQEALVLYYYHECPFCHAVGPTMVDLKQHVDVPVVAINTKQYPQAFRNLQYPSRTVPYIVFHQGSKQTPFSGNRTVEDLTEFIHENRELEGGSHGLLTGRSVDPSQVKPGTFVLYFMPGCGYCQEFAPTFERFATEQNVPVISINVDEHPDIVNELSDELEGVPHLVYIDKKGHRHVFDEDDRTLDQLEFFAVLSRLSDIEITNPKEIDQGLLLYFQPECTFCRDFLPEFVSLLNETDSPSIFAINTQKYPKQDIVGVPHVEYIRDGQRVEYQGVRSTQGLLEFIQEQSHQKTTGDKKVRFESVELQGGQRGQGGQGGQQICHKVLDAINDLNKEAMKFGQPDLFSPHNASVCFVGAATSPKSIKLDRIYLMFMPKKDVMGFQYPVFGVVWGKRGGCFQSKIYMGTKNPRSLIERKLNAGYRRVRETHPVVHDLRDAGYLVRVDTGRRSAII